MKGNYKLELVRSESVPRVVSEVGPVPLPGEGRPDGGGQVGRRQEQLVGGRPRVVELVVVVDADVVRPAAEGRRVRGARPGAEARGRIREHGRLVMERT